MRAVARRLNRIAAVILLLFLSPLFAPQLLAFPYQARSGGLTVYSELPIEQAALDAVTHRSAKLLSASPLARDTEPRRVFLTTGGWRWQWLAFRFRDSFAVSRPLTEPLIFNRSDVRQDKVYAGAGVSAVRSLSGTIAHESCHGLIRRSFGLATDWTKPVWLREGYCDFVAQESALGEARAASLRKSDPDHRALIYFDGRRRVAAELTRNGGNVAALFVRY